MIRKIQLLLVISFFYGVNVWSQEKLPVYLDDSKSIEQRVEDALSRMTLEEKVAMIHAQSKFSTPGCPRLGIPFCICSTISSFVTAATSFMEGYCCSS